MQDSKLTHVCCLLIWMLTLVMAVRHEYAEKLETLYDRVHDKMSNVDGAERGTPMDWTNAKGENAIQVACARGRPEILEMLVLLTLTAVLNHPSMKMDVLQNCENSFSFLRDDNVRNEVIMCHDIDCLLMMSTLSIRQFFPFFVAAKMPAHLEVMEVLIRHSAKLHFPTRQSRDTVRTISYCDIGKKSSFIVGWSVPLLASWLMRVAAGKVSNLLLDLASSKAIRHMQLRRVIQSLTVRRHTYDALLFTLTILFTPQAVDVGQVLYKCSSAMACFSSDNLCLIHNCLVFKRWMLRGQVNSRDPETGHRRAQLVTSFTNPHKPF
ncbi:hypothetical protein GN958_ATG15522 [Phytophthora infestans]|uniref:Secreted RxLR effector peptide protein n=1 Tax=Phytophthora infestans TaxID=4787 RepID=A0A8S9U8V3_PHYIN|nr:hypothetical protein GN958_ATG15522 [Phytophthora infestans]